MILKVLEYDCAALSTRVLGKELSHLAERLLVSCYIVGILIGVVKVKGQVGRAI